jgi:hypothetical protein
MVASRLHNLLNSKFQAFAASRVIYCPAFCTWSLLFSLGLHYFFPLPAAAMSGRDVLVLYAISLCKFRYFSNALLP